jgi:hypothetical protein
MESRQVPEKAPAAMARENHYFAKPTLTVWLRLCLDTEKSDPTYWLWTMDRFPRYRMLP